jgi:flagellar protein FlaG
MGSFMISEGIVLIAAVIIAAGFSVVVLNQMGIFQSTFSTASSAERDIALTKIKTVYATNTSSSEVEVWVKNVGSNQITSLDKMDVYFGKLSSLQLIPYVASGSTSPSWNYTNTGSSSTVWQMTDTLQIKIACGCTITPNVSYGITIATPNGVSDDYVFSVS